MRSAVHSRFIAKVASQFQHPFMNRNVIDIHLDDLQSLTEELIRDIRSVQFEPEVVIYLETGARLLADCFHAATGIATISLTIRRSGSETKARITSLLARLPLFLKNALREMERKLSSQASNNRQIVAATEVDLTNKRILILDDAADSGQSLMLAKRWAIEKGASETDIKMATITITQPRAKELVDFWIYTQLCRFPWSSDSREREQYRKIYEQIDPAKLATRSL